MKTKNPVFIFRGTGDEKLKSTCHFLALVCSVGVLFCCSFCICVQQWCVLFFSFIILYLWEQLCCMLLGMLGHFVCWSAKKFHRSVWQNNAFSFSDPFRDWASLHSPEIVVACTLILSWSKLILNWRDSQCILEKTRGQGWDWCRVEKVVSSDAASTIEPWLDQDSVISCTVMKQNCIQRPKYLPRPSSADILSVKQQHQNRTCMPFKNQR